MNNDGKFKSKYAIETYITAAQYLAEVMCERIAHSLGKQLPFRFWQTDEWKKQFQLQAIQANRWLKEYPMAVIFAGLRRPEAQKIYSFGAKAMLKPILDRTLKQHNVISSTNNSPPAVEVNTEEKPMVTPAKRNKMKDLD
jgi:hypothetical protein